MSLDLRYEERAAPPELGDLLRCVWRLRAPPLAAGTPPAIEPIVPDGCPEIVLNLADPFARAESPTRRREQPRTMFVGQITGPALVGPTGATDVVGIRFLPWGAAGFLGLPLNELTDRFLPLELVVPGAMGELVERLAGDSGDWAGTVFQFMGRARTRATPHPLAAHAYGDIAARGGRVTIRRLAARMHVSERHLERVLRRDVGLSPTLLSRILRVQEALGLLRSAPGASLSRVSAHAGYYDQPHMVREFRRFVGTTPSAYRDGFFELTDAFSAMSSSESHRPRGSAH